MQGSRGLVKYRTRERVYGMTALAVVSLPARYRVKRPFRATGRAFIAHIAVIEYGLQAGIVVGVIKVKLLYGIFHTTILADGLPAVKG